MTDRTAQAPLPIFASMTDYQIADAMLEESTKQNVRPDFSALLGTSIQRKLPPEHAEHLNDNGLVPNVYLAIRWWCFLFIPVMPLGAYAVANDTFINCPFSDSHSRAFPVAMEWYHVGIQMIIGLAVLALFTLGGLWLLAL